MTTTISPLPTPPSPADSPADFNTKAFALLGGLPTFVAEANAQAAGLDASVAAAGAQAAIATNKAGEALTSANNAALSKTDADSARDAAVIAKNAAEAALDSFDDRYLGQKPADPATDNDGGPLLVGALYFRTTAPTGMKVWTGAAWDDAYANLSSKFDKTGGDISGNVNLPSLNGGQLAGLRNKIINGAMGIDQRNGGAAVVDSAGTSPYVVDRWQVITRSGATITAQRGTSGSGSTRWHLGVTITSAKTPASTDQFRVAQVIEGLNVADLWVGTAAAKTVTLSFETCHSVTGTFSGALFNAAFNRSLVFTYTQNAADTWESKSITVPLNTTGTWATDNTAGLIVSFDYGSGSSFQTATVGSWQAGLFLRSSSATTMVSAAGAIFRLQAAQLEVGSVATSFEHRPHGLELDLARRYTRVYAATKSTADLAYEMRATPTQTGSGPYTYSAEL